MPSKDKSVTASRFWQAMIPRLANPKGLAVDRWLMRWFNVSFMGRMFTRAGGYADRPHLILKTIHWKTGQIKSVVLPYVKDGNRYLVVGSHGGRAKDAVWCLNIRAHACSWICVNRQWSFAKATVLSGESRKEGFALVNADGSYSHYTKMTEGIRQLPVVAIEPNFKRSRPQEDTV